jgi:hypothetical protein
MNSQVPVPVLSRQSASFSVPVPVKYPLSYSVQKRSTGTGPKFNTGIMFSDIVILEFTCTCQAASCLEPHPGAWLPCSSGSRA